jgi:hypothetical protein
MFGAAVLLLAAFTLVASVDGFYFHLYRYRLYALPAARREHALHTAQSVLFPLTLVPVFAADVTGAWLLAGVGLFLATFALESADVFTESQSRASLGGLTPTEYWMHFTMSGLRWGAFALAYASVPAAAWTAPASLSWRVPALGAPLAALPWALLVVAVPVAAIHVLLALEGPRAAVEAALRLRPAAAA